MQSLTSQEYFRKESGTMRYSAAHMFLNCAESDETIRGTYK